MVSTRHRAALAAAIVSVCALGASSLRASTVEIYQSADNPDLTVGQTTTVHVYALVTSTDDGGDGVGAFDVNVDATENGAFTIVADSVVNDSDIPVTTETYDSNGIEGVDGIFLGNNVGYDTPAELFSYQITGAASGPGTLSIEPDNSAGLGGDGVYLDNELIDETPPTKTFDPPIEIDVSGSGSAVPEPATVGLLGLGLAAAGLRRRRR